MDLETFIIFIALWAVGYLALSKAVGLFSKMTDEAFDLSRQSHRRRRRR